LDRKPVNALPKERRYVILKCLHNITTLPKRVLFFPSFSGLQRYNFFFNGLQSKRRNLQF
jgi:hypothetical protein